MTTRSSRSATKLGIAALVSFSLVAAACGGSDDNADQDSGTENTEASEPDAEPDAEPEPEPDAEATPDTEPERNDTDDLVDEPEETGPVQGGTLRYGLEADSNGINPANSSLASSGLMMGNAVFDTLAAYNTDGVARAVPGRVVHLE